LQAIFAYGFGELGVEEMFLGTNKETTHGWTWIERYTKGGGE